VPDSKLTVGPKSNPDRIAPQNLEAERIVLGAILIENDTLAQARKLLAPDDFYLPSHAKIFRAMIELSERRKPVDVVALSDFLEARGEIEAIGGATYMVRLAGDVPTPDLIEYYARKVKKESQKRRWREALIAEIDALDLENDVPAARGRLICKLDALGNGSETAITLRMPLLVNLKDVARENVAWLWRDRIPRRKLTLFDGDPGVGKSWLSLAIATAVSKGEGLPSELAMQPSHVLLLTAEDGLGDTVRPRLEDMAADLSLIVALRGLRDEQGQERSLTLHDLDVLESALKEHRPALLIVDPIIAFTPGVDTHHAVEVRGVLAPLAALAERYGPAIVGVRHLTKNSARTLYRGQGSIDFLASCRSAFLVGEDPDDPNKRVMCHIKSNLAPKTPSLTFSIDKGRFLWGGESSLTPEQILAVPVENDERSAMEEAQEFVIELLDSGPQSAKDIMTEARKNGIADRTLRRARAALGIKSRKSGFGGGWVWDLPARRWPKTPEDVQPGHVDTLGKVGHLRDEEEGWEEV
jgi:hypothetical protein